MNILNLKTVSLVIVLLFVFISPVEAKKKKNDDKNHSEVTLQSQISQLEQELREDFGVEKLARYQADLRTYEQWPEDLDDRLRLYVAVRWFEKGHVREAFGVLRDLPKVKGYEGIAKYHRAIALIHSGKAIQATTLIADLEKEYPGDLEVIYIKSSFLAESNDLEGAIEVLDRLIKKDKQSGKAYLQRGIFNMLIFANDSAIRDFKKAIRYLPKHDTAKLQQAYLQTGLIYWKIKMDRKQAKVFFDKGVHLAPNSELVRQVSDAIRQE